MSVAMRFSRVLTRSGRGRLSRARLFACLALGLASIAFLHCNPPAFALSIEITGGGADRLERQRAWSEGELPLPGTPDLSKLQERLAAAGLREGAPVFVRIFKSESELELWMQKGRDFVLFATYPICQWSGIVGPKFYEGDNQSPEGFYTVGRRDLKWQTRHHRAFNIGFPNAYDRQNGRTGSNILVHGGCSTEGCFAMTNPVIDEIFRLANSAVASGQREFQVHVFPFRMTAENLLQNSASPWLDFWINLKTGYDLFAETRVPPKIGMCRNRYSYDRVPEFGALSAVGDCDAPAGAAAEPVAEVEQGSESAGAIVTTGAIRATAASPMTIPKAAEAQRIPVPKRVSRERSRARDGLPPDTGSSEPLRAGPPPEMGSGLVPAPTESRPARKAAETPSGCNLSRASCRKWSSARALAQVERARTAHQRAHRTKSSVALLR